MEIIERAEICQGATKIRTLLGVQTELAVLVGVLALGPVAAFWSWWPVPALAALWLFLRWQTRKDPQCVGVWVSHLTLEAHYE